MSYELLLINISRDLSGYSESFRDSIGQYLIAAYLREHFFKAYVYSGNIQECKEVIQEEIEKRNVPVVGFYAAADNIRIVAHAVRWIKRNYPEVKTIVGGPQAIGLDYDFFDKTKNDFAIIGEGEIPMYLLLSALIDNEYEVLKVPSLVIPDRKNRTLIINSCDNAVISDLDMLPYPSMEDSLKGNLRQGKMVGIITGRGCPYQCTFCYEGANAKRVRLRSIDNVMEEIDYISQNNSNLKFLNIYDDTFTLKPERVLEFCEKIKSRNLKWFCEGHIRFVLSNPDVLKIMIESGLTCIQFGIESGSSKVLSAYNKQTNYNMIHEAVALCKRAGIHGITGNFIIGGAFESEETIAESKKLVKDLIFSAKGIIEIYTVYFAPYPNTKIVNEPGKYNLEVLLDLEDYNLNTMRSPVVKTNELSTEKIYQLKHEFEAYVEQIYKEAAADSDKNDILQGLYAAGKRININPTWQKHYLSFPHIVTFLEHLSKKEQQFNENYYIIRTFEDIVLNGDIMISEVGTFTGIEKDVLANATGIYTAKEMAVKFGVSVNEIESIYYKFNEKCMLYMSEF